jgi:hypothetical protein
MMILRVLRLRTSATPLYTGLFAFSALRRADFCSAFDRKETSP